MIIEIIILKQNLYYRYLTFVLIHVYTHKWYSTDLSNYVMGSTVDYASHR